MWIVVLLAIGVVVAFWQVILAGLVLWALVACLRWWIVAVAEARPKPSHTRKPVQTRPAARPVQTRPVARTRKPEPKPARELPVPDYLPRWTASRRLDAGREHAQWQTKFDNAAHRNPAGPGARGERF